MVLKAIVKADHKTKKATLSLIDEETGFSPVDFRGEELRDMAFPYNHIFEYDTLFDNLGKDSDGFDYFHFRGIGFNKA
jgi:hypothetical protein